MKKLLVLAYGIACYAAFFATFLYAVLWIGNLGVPNSLDSEPTSSLGFSIAVNLLLLTAFAVQHSLMARPVFKQWMRRYQPDVIERSTYVLASSLALALIFLLWQPLGGSLWYTTNPILVALLYSCYAAGWILVFVSTFLISHADLFGLRQTWNYFRGRASAPLNFRMPGIYRHVRHPLYLGWLIVMWSTPTMTGSHFLFAVGTTAYILIGIRFEERDLERAHGVAYSRYKNEVPMLIPSFVKLEDESGVQGAV